MSSHKKKHMKGDKSSSNEATFSRRQVAGDGAHGRTVFDSVYHGRPEYGFYSDAEMAKMGAKVGGCGDKKKHRQVAGDGAHGHTVFDSVYHGRPEYGFYSDAEMAKMGAKVGGHGGHGPCGGCGGCGGCPACSHNNNTVYVVEGSDLKQSGGSNETNSQHKMRIRGIISNMIDVSDSSDSDIIEVLKNELKQDNRTKYTKKEAEQILKEYYVFHQEKAKKTINGNRKFPSSLLGKFMNEHQQKGGNRVTLPLSFFNGEIPDKIVVPAHVDNYCAF